MSEFERYSVLKLPHDACSDTDKKGNCILVK